MPSARCSMLDRAPQDDRTTEARPVAFRGAGFVPKAGRASGWTALALVIALWQLAGSAGWVNPLFLPAPSAIAVAIPLTSPGPVRGLARFPGRLA